MGNALTAFDLPLNIEKERNNYTLSQTIRASSVFDSLNLITRIEDSTDFTLAIASFFDDQRRVSNQREKANSPYLANIFGLEPVFSTSLGGGPMTASGTRNKNLILLMEPIQTDLRSHLESRKMRKEQFLEVEIARIVDNVVSALMALRTKSTTHGGLDLTNIYLSSDGSYKLLDMGFAFGDSINYYKAVENPGKNKFYLSPALLTSLGLGLSVPDSNKEKDDVFALGMIILELYTLESNLQFYQTDRFKIDFEGLKEKLNKISGSTSAGFSKLLQSMLEENERIRLNTYELFQAIMNWNNPIPLTPMNSVDSVYLKSSGIQGMLPSGSISHFELEDMMFESMNTRIEGNLKSQSTPLSDRKSLNYITENVYLSPGETTRPNKPEAKYSTPIRVEEKIHIAPPGSQGKNVIKIVYTPTRESQEKMEQYEKEYQFNKERIEKENKSMNKSLDFLSDTIDFLKLTNSSPHKSIDVLGLCAELTSPSRNKENK